MGATTRGFRYSELNDPPNEPLQLKNLADDIQAEFDNALTLGSSLTVPGNLIVGAGSVTLNPQLVIKSANESVSSSITLQNDDHLTLPVVANKKYFVKMGLSTDGASTNDFKMDFAAITGATCLLHGNGLHFQAPDATQDTVQLMELLSDVMVFGCLGATDHRPVDVSGIVQMAGTAGNLQLRWAQNASGATATRVLAGSYLLAIMMG